MNKEPKNVYTGNDDLLEEIIKGDMRCLDDVCGIDGERIDDKRTKSTTISLICDESYKELDGLIGDGENFLAEFARENLWDVPSFEDHRARMLIKYASRKVKFMGMELLNFNKLKGKKCINGDNSGWRRYYAGGYIGSVIGIENNADVAFDNSSFLENAEVCLLAVKEYLFWKLSRFKNEYGDKDEAFCQVDYDLCERVIAAYDGKKSVDKNDREEIVHKMVHKYTRERREENIRKETFGQDKEYGPSNKCKKAELQELYNKVEDKCEEIKKREARFSITEYDCLNFSGFISPTMIAIISSYDDNPYVGKLNTEMKRNQSVEVPESFGNEDENNNGDESEFIKLILAHRNINLAAINDPDMDKVDEFAGKIVHSVMHYSGKLSGQPKEISQKLMALLQFYNVERIFGFQFIDTIAGDIVKKVEEHGNEFLDGDGKIIEKKIFPLINCLRFLFNSIDGVLTRIKIAGELVDMYFRCDDSNESTNDIYRKMKVKVRRAKKLYKLSECGMFLHCASRGWNVSNVAGNESEESMQEILSKELGYYRQLYKLVQFLNEETQRQHPQEPKQWDEKRWEAVFTEGIDHEHVNRRQDAQKQNGQKLTKEERMKAEQKKPIGDIAISVTKTCNAIKYLNQNKTFRETFDKKRSNSVKKLMFYQLFIDEYT